MLSCEFYEMSKSTFFTEHLWKTEIGIAVCLELWFLSSYVPDCCKIGKWEQIWYAHPKKFINFSLLIDWLPTVIHKLFGTNSSFEIVHYRKSLISIFQEFFFSINKILIFAGTLGARPSFYGVWTCCWYFLIS